MFCLFFFPIVEEKIFFSLICFSSISPVIWSAFPGIFHCAADWMGRHDVWLSCDANKPGAELDA